MNQRIFNQRIIQHHQFIKLLGKASTNKIILCKKQENYVAINIIQKKYLKSSLTFKSQLEKTFQNLQNIKPDFIVKLNKFVEDQHNIYLFYQYCNGGNLIDYQNMIQNKVITMEKACKILSELIQGLQQLQKHGCYCPYLKIQDIFIKYQNNDEKFLVGNYIRQENIENATIMNKFIAPQILHRQKLKKTTDVWALGTIFFFMLNNQYPINKYIQGKQQKNRPVFSYQKMVKKTKKKLLINATNEFEELFRRIFEYDPQKRITLHEIKKYPSIKKYFEIGQKIFFESQNCKFKNILQQLNHCFARVCFQCDCEKMDEPIKIKKNFQNEIQQLIFHTNHKEFIYCLSQYFKNQNVYFHKSELKSILRYNLLKLYIVEAKKLYHALSQKRLSDEADINLNLCWKTFFESQDYQRIMTKFHNEILSHQKDFRDSYWECQLYYFEIQKNCPDVMPSIRQEVIQTNFEEFKKPFKIVTNYAIKTIDQINKNCCLQVDAPRLTDLRIRVYICHLINQVFNRKELHQNFKYYFEWKLKNNTRDEYAQSFNFQSFKVWLIREQKAYKIKTINFLFKKYFG